MMTLNRFIEEKAILVTLSLSFVGYLLLGSYPSVTENLWGILKSALVLGVIWGLGFACAKSPEKKAVAWKIQDGVTTYITDQPEVVKNNKGLVVCEYAEQVSHE